MHRLFKTLENSVKAGFLAGKKARADTLQGWLKGVNSSSMLHTQDMGQDGSPGIYADVARDVFGYSIDYYNDSLRGIFDYLPINQNATPFLAYRNTSNLNDTTKNLYNGNISYLTTSIPSPLGLDMQYQNISPVSMVRNFKYDKLNRISKQEIAYITNNVWQNKTLNYFANYSYDPNGNLLSLNRNDTNVAKMDSLQYSYYTSNKDYYNGQSINRLQQVVDRANTTTYPLDFEGTSNYTYDEIGNLVTDSGEDIDSIVWNTYGKIRKVIRVSNSVKSDLEFWYDPMGNRLCKIEKPRPGGDSTKQNEWTFTWYIRDAQGNIMATYQEIHESENDYGILMLREFPIYGSSRLGVQNADRYEDTLSKIQYLSNTFDNDGFYTSRSVKINLKMLDTTSYYYYPIFKEYEFSNHLGNVLATISAKPILVDSTQDNIIDYRTAHVLSVNDYYPFGSTMPGRSWTSGWDSYRFAFNGKEKDSEGMGGGGSTYDYGFRIYNPQIGRFLSVDPLFKEYPELTTYQFAGNIPISCIDIDGKEPESVISNGKVTLPIIGFVSGAFDIKKNVINETNWLHGAESLIWTIAKPGAITLNKAVYYSPEWQQSTDVGSWVGLVSHEQTHRQRIQVSSSVLYWYASYLKQNASGVPYLQLTEEIIAYHNEDVVNSFFSNAQNSNLFNSILNNETLSNQIKASKLELLGIEKIKIPETENALNNVSKQINSLETDIANNPLKTEIKDGKQFVNDTRNFKLSMLKSTQNILKSELNNAKNDSKKLRNSGVTY